jgi:hypothetical protein
MTMKIIIFLYYVNQLILNSIRRSIFLCTKEINDNHDFEINSIPTVSSDDFKIG